MHPRRRAQRGYFTAVVKQHTQGTSSPNEATLHRSFPPWGEEAISEHVYCHTLISTPTSSKSTMPRPELESPPQAFISGYYMNYSDFKKLVEAFRPEFVQAHARRGVSPGYMGYAFEFNRWKLNLPEDERAKIPVLRLLHDRTRPADAHNHNPDFTKFFFATRYIDAPEDSIIDDFPEAINELEEDRVQRDDFRAMVKKRTGCAYSLDEATLQFGCFRYDHPLYDDFILESNM